MKPGRSFLPPPKSFDALTAIILAALSVFSTHAYSQTKEPEERFVGGVFDQRGRVTPEQLARSAEASKPVRPPAFFKEPEVDETGAASQILMLVNAASNAGELSAQVAGKSGCRTITQCELAFLEIVNAQQDDALLRLLGRPTGARFLAEDYRLSDEERAQLKSDDAGLALQKTVMLRYGTVKDARAALKQLVTLREFSQAALDQTMVYSTGWDWPQSLPNDPYLTQQSNPNTYQWGMHKMNFATAWYFTPGNAYLGAIDGGVPLASETPQYFGNCWTGYNYVYSFHCDLAENFRPQFSLAPGGFFETRAIHGTHVTGIMAARGDNSQGVSGGCPWCSVAMGRMNGPNAGGGGALASNAAAALIGLTDRGMQAINISANAFGGNTTPSWRGSLRCFESTAGSFFAFCYSIAYANSRDVNLVASAGNYRWTNREDNVNVPVPTLPATSPFVLSVGGIQPDGAMWSHYGLENPLPTIETPALPWQTEASSAFAGQYGVVAPAVNVISTMPWAGAGYSPNLPYANCGDSPGADLSGIYFDKYGTCTGTSMAAPHVTALVGLVRSVNPLLNRAEVECIVTGSGDLLREPVDCLDRALATPERGSGVPDAGLAVVNAIATNPSRLTPLFSFYSAARKDYFYTIVPQMAGAAIRGTLRPVNDAYVGTSSSYTPVGTGLWFVQNFPNLCCGFGTPLAQAWVFTTPTNPNSWEPLSPLFRLSWKCGDGGQWPPVCSVTPAHTDTTYTADPAGIAAFTSVGYSLDGVEGYIYPKSTPRPSGTVRLLRKYNATNDDHAIFPEVASIVTSMTNQGYTQNSGSDWLGWVYPNYGSRPVVY